MCEVHERRYSKLRLIFVFQLGLLLFSLIISDIIERFTEADTVIMGDVSFLSSRM